MKGLILNCIGKKDEAYDLVRLGLRNNLRSHVCWHVYGLIQRSDRKYDEAIKCYINALKWDKDNLQILRDLSLLQIHMRDLQGFNETRYQLLALRPAQRVSWVGYAISHHLLKEYDVAIKILDELKKFETVGEYDYEKSELCLYQNMIMQEAGMVDEALQHLDSHEKVISDPVSVLESKGCLYMMNGSLDLAANVYFKLIMRNPECWSYYFQLVKALQLNTESQKLSLFDNLHKRFPKSEAPLRLALGIATGIQFMKRCDTYLRRALHKGLPSLFMNIYGLYDNEEKVLAIEKLMLGYRQCLMESSKFSVDSSEEEPPTVLLWTLLYLTQHYDKLGNVEQALNFVNMACEHTPTLLECMIARAKVYKHAGNIEMAAEAMDDCQTLDTADRYVNCKCAKYLIRCNRVEDAAEMCAKFTREGVPPMDNLNDMQCMWFLTECAASYARTAQYGKALKKCHEVNRHFDDILDDQFDFHTYCMRKMTLRAYIGLLRLEDNLHQHRFFFKAARIAIKVYLYLYDHPISEQEEIDESTLTPSELKKLRRKQEREKRKVEDRRKKEEEDRQKQINRQKKEDGDAEGPRLELLLPEKLEKTEKPLDEAIKFLKPLLSFAKERIETHLLSFEVFYRRDKILLMMQAIIRAHALNPFNPELHICKVKFLMRMAASPPADIVAEVIKRQTSHLFECPTPELLNKAWLSQSSSYLQLFAGAVVDYMLDSSKKDAILEDFFSKTLEYPKLILKDCLHVAEKLKTGDVFGNVKEDVQCRYMTFFAKTFPYSSVFQTPGSITNGLEPSS